MKRLLRANPFLSVGLLGLLLMGLWIFADLPHDDGGVGEALFRTWRVLAAPVHAAANLLSPVTDTWPDALDAAAVIVVGLLPYIVADFLWRRIRRGRW